MQSLSVFDIFKIGLGPSSSHTMGPWNAARAFASEVLSIHPVAIQVELYGSLAKTGLGHATDVAIIMGLSGHDATTVDVEQVATIIAQARASKTITLGGNYPVSFDPATDIQFCNKIEMPAHPNTMRFRAKGPDGLVQERVVYSIGGGFILREGEPVETNNEAKLPLPIHTAADMLGHCKEHAISISELVRRNECSLRSNMDLDLKLDQILVAMKASIHRGCQTAGMLPGPLQVRRRAKDLAVSCGAKPGPGTVDDWIELLRERTFDFPTMLKWVSCFALAVNEENAAMGRVVTAPTNGAAGVIPAVLMYHLCFRGGDQRSAREFLMTASEIGCLFKKGATISAAMGGCQAEIGVSSSMAAAALCEVEGGHPRQAAMAAEIAMEHHLGLTCDPIGGLVQVPCIERNAMGAIKAITASQLALQTDPDHARVSLDDVIATMWATAQDMNSRYKETSEGGLALQIPVSLSDC